MPNKQYADMVVA